MAASTPTLEAYSELQRAFDFYNRSLFDNVLPPCLITLQRKNQTYGYFDLERFVHRSDLRKTDEIALNPVFFCTRPISEVLSTLVHEMVHSWQFHFGTPGRRGYHNREWAEKMESIGLMPSSTGREGGKRTGEHMSHYVVHDGPFMRVTTRLLDDDFGISWLDRFPVVPDGFVLPPTVAAPRSNGDDEPGARGGYYGYSLDDEPGLEPGGGEPGGGEPGGGEPGGGEPGGGEPGGGEPGGGEPGGGEPGGGEPGGGEPGGGEPAPTLRDLIAPVPRGPNGATNRSNRVKYRCPSCAAQVWGKPGLKLLCGVGECNAVPFSPVE